MIELTDYRYVLFYLWVVLMCYGVVYVEGCTWDHSDSAQIQNNSRKSGMVTVVSSVWTASKQFLINAFVNLSCSHKTMTKTVMNKLRIIKIKSLCLLHKIGSVQGFLTAVFDSGKYVWQLWSHGDDCHQTVALFAHSTQQHQCPV